jgi:hypothetical protein
MNDRELMQMALDALSQYINVVTSDNDPERWAVLVDGGGAARKAMKALSDRLAQPEYDQTALELCNVCGWKAVVPDECCLNCKRLAQPEPWVKTYCGGKPNYTTQPELGEPWDSMPVAFINIDGELSYIKGANTDKELYAAPPKREWVGLTEDEFEEVLAKYNEALPVVVCRAIEAKLKEKNT